MINANEIKKSLDNLFPIPKCELNYNSAYELLVAVILSAQCTDKRVNIITNELFKNYNTPQKMIALEQSELEDVIKSCGFYHNKAKNILKMSEDLLLRYNGQVPSNLEDLQSLSGVGRKTANVVLGEYFKQDAFAVDTHVLRVSGRLGIIKTKDPKKCELTLTKFFEKKDWSKLHLQFVLFGRYVCKSLSPNCDKCPFYQKCCSKDKKVYN